MSRRSEPLLRECEDVPESLKRALRVAESDELPTTARLKRIEGHLVAEVIASSSRRASDPDVERWREIAVRRQLEKSETATSAGRAAATSPRRWEPIRFAIVAVAAMAAAWIALMASRANPETASSPAPVSQLPPVHLAPLEPPTDEPQRVAPGPSRPVASLSAPNPVSSAVDGPSPCNECSDRDWIRERPSPGVPSPTPSASSVRKASPILTRSDPWGISSAPKAPPLAIADNPVPARQKHGPAPSAAVEEDLLERATRALATDPQAALSLMDQHRAAFPNGNLGQERDVIIIQALARLGRLDAAQAVAKRFLAEHPDSPYAKDVLNMAGAPRR